MPSIAASETREARADSEQRPPARLVVELDHAVGNHQRVVIRQRDDAGSEPDALGSLSGGGDEKLGRPVDLESARMMLADPRLVVSELVEEFDELEIPLHAQRRILVIRVERGQKDTGAKLLGLSHRFLLSAPARLPS
jgi:hypothetical protein